jgi:hypothetical protein
LAAKAVKKAFRWRRCVCLSRELTRESSMQTCICKHTFQTICDAVHHSLKRLCGVGQPKRSEQILEQD